MLISYSIKAHSIVQYKVHYNNNLNYSVVHTIVIACKVKGVDTGGALGA